jgi:acyl-homoserine lactone acylase PvdQ
MRLFNDAADLQARHAASPLWLKRLMQAWADGLNHYLATHPETRPRVLTRFEPWMALSFTEGSIGADFERVDLRELQAFYERRKHPRASPRSVDRGFHLRPQAHPQKLMPDQVGMTSLCGKRTRPAPTASPSRRDHRRRQGAAAHQPAHQLLLPFRTAGHQRRGPQRVRRHHLGPILHLSGLQ